MVLAVPEAVEAALKDFDEIEGPIDLHDVQTRLAALRRELAPSTQEAFRGASVDLLAVGLAPWPGQAGPWGTFYGPSMTFEDAAGVQVHQPDIAEEDADTIAHWRARAETLRNPTLKARYADLVWDLGPTITKDRRRDGVVGEMALDAHRVAMFGAANMVEAFAHGRRAMQLAIALSKAGKIDEVRAELLTLHAQAEAAGEMWWEAYDILTEQRRSGLTDDELGRLVGDLEARLKRYADAEDGSAFDPWFVERTSDRLLGHYRRKQSRDDERRIYAIVARATEHQAARSSALLASSVLNTSMEAYRKAGMAEEAERVRRIMAEKVKESAGEMATFRHEIRVTFDEVEAFQAKIVDEDVGQTLVNIAIEFLLRRAQLEEAVQAEAKVAPLTAMITQTIIDGDRVVASVGSTDEDPYGRVLRQAVLALNLTTMWLSWAIEAAVERHGLHAGHFTAWANRSGLFNDGVLLAEGLDAWLAGDLTKAIHVLVPQVELGLRNLTGAVGRPTSKAHPVFKEAQVAVTMGDAIYNKDTVAALGKLGEDLALHLAALYADPRGFNLRNELAHGLVDRTEMTQSNAFWIVHTLLVLGAWRNPSD